MTKKIIKINTMIKSNANNGSQHRTGVNATSTRLTDFKEDYLIVN